MNSVTCQKVTNLNFKTALSEKKIYMFSRKCEQLPSNGQRVETFVQLLVLQLCNILSKGFCRKPGGGQFILLPPFTPPTPNFHPHLPYRMPPLHYMLIWRVAKGEI